MITEDAVTIIPDRSAVAQRVATRPFGHIVSVAGAQAVAALEMSPEILDLGSIDRIEIGVLIKIPTPVSSVVGIVSSMSSPAPAVVQDEKEIRLIELSLAGEIFVDKQTGERYFRRGISNSPALGDPVAHASHEDLACVYSQPHKPTIDVGTLFQDLSVPARLLVDELFGKHFLVVGTTGSGKSSAVTAILGRVLEEYRHAHIVVFDVHNEYGQVFGDKAELISPSNLRLPFWLLNFRELCSALTTPDGDRDAEVQILSDAILAAKRRNVGGQVAQIRSAVEGSLAKRIVSRGSAITVDTPTPFHLSDVISYLDDQLGKLERTQPALAYMRLKDQIEAISIDPRYGFMFRSLSAEDTMADVLGRIFRVPADEKTITVIDLAAVPPEILDIVISLIARLAFDLALWSEGGIPMLLVCEEAHRYARPFNGEKALPTSQALARIAKEGRKYGISIGLVTQRPSELDSTIISQCSTVFAMRLTTDRDQAVMRANTHDSALDLMEYLPVLGDREAIVLGQGVPMPMRIRFRDLGEGEVPRNCNGSFSGAWKNPNIDRPQLDEIVGRWRSMGRYCV